MKKIILLTLTVLSFSAFSDSRYSYTGKYTTQGSCENGSSSVEVLTENQWLGGVGTGPSDDGQSGCAEANAILNCASKSGTFEYGFIKMGGFEMKTPVIFSFECK